LFKESRTLVPEIYLPVTTVLISALALLLVTLSWRVIQSRDTTQVSLGTGGNATLERRVRAQANLTEYAPIFVILIAVAELQGGNCELLSITAALFFIGRVAHGYAMAFTTGNIRLRVTGTFLTLTTTLVATLYNVVMLALQ
jgi:uncharacterized membrane protein YecN with MAPEG domain